MQPVFLICFGICLLAATHNANLSLPSGLLYCRASVVSVLTALILLHMALNVILT